MKRSTEIKLRKLVTGLLKEEQENYQIHLYLGRKLKRGKNFTPKIDTRLVISGQEFRFVFSGDSGIKFTSAEISSKPTAINVFNSLKTGVEPSDGFVVTSIGLFSKSDENYIAVK